MIDDATLAGWENDLERMSSVYAPRMRDAIAEIRRLREDLNLLVNRTEPEPHALHYDECPYKPFADLDSWPVCTCATRAARTEGRDD